MHYDDISPLILGAISKHCEDGRVENVIVNLLKEMMENDYSKKINGSKLFKGRYKAIILDNFKEELKDE